MNVEIKVPGKDIVANRELMANFSHENPMTAVEEAFAAAMRQLQDYIRCKRKQ